MSGSFRVMCAIATATALGVPLSTQAQPVRDLITYACAATMPSGKQRLVFAEALDKPAARRLADRVQLVDGPGKKVAPRSVQECIDLAKEKFIDPKAAELLANTPR